MINNHKRWVELEIKWKHIPATARFEVVQYKHHFSVLRIKARFLFKLRSETLFLLPGSQVRLKAR